MAEELGASGGGLCLKLFGVNIIVESKKGGRKKGKPWSEEEHRKFLEGLEKLGKGDWKGISKKFVSSRTSTQVASHAQKYFLRQISSHKKKRRSRLFDMSREQTATSSSQASPSETPSHDARTVNTFPHLCLDQYPGADPGYAAGNIPNMVGFALGGKTRAAAPPVLHMANYAYAPITSHHSPTTNLSLFPVNYLAKASSSATIRKEDPLDLKIGPSP
ncbi:probable transcription factor At5g61620 [Mercurialis annua]|uniref:probable transcription factor At5g61620 n=1 Tax=Mercurialis annua TaxID=3986 RepID=UPI00215DE862|nr:probable transcription factor At5g61620 [Mercurialis annua]